jgi:hypothetical protein
MRTCTDTACRGGEEVLLDVGGQDATEAFEDVGHSDEAREILEGLLVGTLKRQVCTTALNTHLPDTRIRLTLLQPGDPAPKVQASNSSSSSSSGSATGFGIGLYAIILLGGAAAFYAYQYMQSQQTKA